ncbi:MAG TPA: phytanoyl-CoA dioxygenase [Lentisphaeria bacterium]|mgnify:CR=1 FL=1|nr:phytanoyl-CoA dioxygenase [Lentisphaeria bacterium]
MNFTLTDEQIAAYGRDGFVPHRAFLSPDEVTELKGAVLDAISDMGKNKIASRDDSQTMTDGDSYYDSVFTQKLNLWRISDTVKRYMLHPELGRMLTTLERANEITADDDDGPVEGFRVWHDQALIKEPYGNPTAWHLDNPYWSFRSRHALSIWIALEDATPENGNMWFVPGSHRLANFDNIAIGQNLVGLFKIYPKMTAVDPVSVPMKAGDCSFHNGLTAHGAGANMTRGRRVAMTCAYMPIGSTFNGSPNILPPVILKQLEIGDVLDNDDWNPIV